MNEAQKRATERWVAVQRREGLNDVQIWLLREFGVWHTGQLEGRNLDEPCQWCKSSAPLLYQVPGITPDGRMNLICYRCAHGKYASQAHEEMEDYAHVRPAGLDERC
jgi:hypothetical protein